MTFMDQGLALDFQLQHLLLEATVMYDRYMCRACVAACAGWPLAGELHILRQQLSFMMYTICIPNGISIVLAMEL